MRKTVLFVLLSLFAVGLRSQDFNDYFYFSHSIHPTDSGKLYLSFENTNFIKNDEYYGKLLSGYTFIGFFMRPQLVYYPHKNLKISAGAHILKYSGLDRFTSILPVFTVQYSPVKRVNVLLGSLNGSLNHKMIEPLYDFERYFTHNVENGLQVLLNTRRLTMDLWVEWEHFIFRTGTEQEHVIIGTNMEFLLTKHGSVSRLSIPFQAIVAHKGGQYHKPNQILQMLINTAFGLKYAIRTNNKWINSIGMESYYLGFNDASAIFQLPYSKGHAISFNVFLKSSFMQLWAGYWNGYHFISSRGNPLFESVSQENPTFLLPKSELLTAKLSLRKKIYNDVSLEARFESYYDLPQKQFQYAYSIYLIFNRNFFLGKIKSYD